MMRHSNVALRGADWTTAWTHELARAATDFRLHNLLGACDHVGSSFRYVRAHGAFFGRVTAHETTSWCVVACGSPPGT